jgi:hypothetical protein
LVALLLNGEVTARVYLLLVLATRYKNMYWWLHGGYMTTKEKGFTTKLIAANPYCDWWELRDSNSRPTD